MGERAVPRPLHHRQSRSCHHHRACNRTTCGISASVVCKRINGLQPHQWSARGLAPLVSFLQPTLASLVCSRINGLQLQPNQWSATATARLVRMNPRTIGLQPHQWSATATARLVGTRVEQWEQWRSTGAQGQCRGDEPEGAHEQWKRRRVVELLASKLLGSTLLQSGAPCFKATVEEKTRDGAPCFKASSVSGAAAGAHARAAAGAAAVHVKRRIVSFTPSCHVSVIFLVLFVPAIYNTLYNPLVMTAII